MGISGQPEQTNRTDVRKLALLCAVVYFSGYVTRVTLAAVLVAVDANGFASQETAAFALSMMALFYGVGQLISGWLGDRLDPRYVVFAGLAVTSSCNVAAGLFGGSALVPVWAVNGFAQSLLWPPLVRIMATNMDRRSYDRTCAGVNIGALAGTVSVYLVSPLLIELAGIRSVFFASASVSTLLSVVWMVRAPRMGPAAGREENAIVRDGFAGARKYVLLVMIVCAALLFGSLRDGITNWMPVYLYDRFGIDSSSAILAGILIPLAGIAAYALTGFVHEKVLKNEMTCAAAVFAVGACAAAVLLLFGSGSAVLSAICLALAAGSTHGINLIIISVVPPYFARRGRVSLVAGVLNAFVYAGGAGATYGVSGLLAENGQEIYRILIICIAAAGGLLCLAASAFWKKRAPAEAENNALDKNAES
ncbi:MAG: MFS transporter [Clostridia bacterium]|nr:MFS transporter [Clostridia bacterium]